MAITKPAVLPAWADGAAGTDITQPTNAQISAGWTPAGVIPSRQWFNWLLNFSANGVRYFSRRGLVDYDAAETYLARDIVRGDDGLIYQSLQANNTGHTPSTSPTWWGPAQAKTPSTGDASADIATTAFVAAGFLPIGTTFAGIAGQIQNGQVPLSAVLQWQGSLSIGGNQVTSPVANATTAAKANTLLLNGYATFNWSGQAGQPSWLLGSNDGVNVFVYNPANFSVSFATSSGTATSASNATTATGPANAAAFLETLMTSAAVTLQADPGGVPPNGTPGSIVWYY